MFLSLHILGNIFEIYFIQKQIVDILLLHYSCLWGFLSTPPNIITLFLTWWYWNKGKYMTFFFFKLKTFLYLNWNLSYWNKINYWIHHIKGHIFSMLTFVFPSACQKSIWRWWEICHIQDQVEFNNLYNLYLWC